MSIRTLDSHAHTSTVCQSDVAHGVVDLATAKGPIRIRLPRKASSD